MSEINPYEAPGIPVTAAPVAHISFEGLAATMRETRPWVRLISVVVLVGLALMVLVAIGLTIDGALTDKIPLWIGPLYLVLATVYVAPGIFLHRYASAITTFLQDTSTEKLNTALKQQKSFWKYAGILTAVMVAAYILFVAVALLFAVVTGAMGKH